MATGLVSYAPLDGRLAHKCLCAELRWGIMFR